jgi:hypothetical protein
MQMPRRSSSPLRRACALLTLLLALHAVSGCHHARQYEGLLTPARYSFVKPRTTFTSCRVEFGAHPGGAVAAPGCEPLLEPEDRREIETYVPEELESVGLLIPRREDARPLVCRFDRIEAETRGSFLAPGETRARVDLTCFTQNPPWRRTTTYTRTPYEVGETGRKEAVGWAIKGAFRQMVPLLAARLVELDNGPPGASRE